jgi:hypothetical protein
MATTISNGCAHSASLPPEVERPPGALRPPEGALGALRPPGSSSTIGSAARARSGAKDRVARPKARWTAEDVARLGPFGAAKPSAAARLTVAARAVAAAAAAKPRAAPSPGKPRAATSSAKTAAATSAKTAAATSAKTAVPLAAAVASGYAAAASTTPKTTTTRGEWDFLKDPKISFDEKLMRFLKLYAQKSEDEVVKKMEEMKGGLPASSTSSTSSPSSSTTSKPKSSGLGGLLKATLGGAVSALASAPAIRGFVKQVSGPVLAAAATAVGLPGLAPVVAQGGSKVADLLLDAADGLGKSLSGSTTSSASSGSATGASTTASSEPKRAESEKAQLIELEYLVEKQKEAFTALSNMLRANHEMRMSAVQNLR